MENSLFPALAVAIVLLSIIIVLWRTKKLDTEKNQSRIAELETDLNQQAEDNQQLMLKLAVVEEKLLIIFSLLIQISF